MLRNKRGQAVIIMGYVVAGLITLMSARAIHETSKNGIHQRNMCMVKCQFFGNKQDVCLDRCDNNVE